MNLNDLNAIGRIDKSGMLSSIAMFPDQCEQAWLEGNQVDVPQHYSNVKNILIAGMGGSALCGRILSSLYQKHGLLLPLEVVNDYYIPDYVNENSLVILSSYSGDTEETLSAAGDALRKKAKILGVTTGGKLGDFIQNHKIPAYIFDPKYNPCSQPRIGLGYSTMSVIALLFKSKLLTLEKPEKISQTFKALRSVKGNVQIKAQEVVKKIIGKIPLVIGAEFLSGNAHVVADEFNKNAKTLSFSLNLPEMSHYLLEGLKNPNTNNLIFLLLKSNIYTRETQKHEILIKKAIKKNGLDIIEYLPTGREPLLEVLETLWFGSFLSFYLAISYNLNPSLIPWIEYVKRELHDIID